MEKGLEADRIGLETWFGEQGSNASSRQNWVESPQLLRKWCRRL
jgi:hypothetical protein